MRFILIYFICKDDIGVHEDTAMNVEPIMIIGRVSVFPGDGKLYKVGNSWKTLFEVVFYIVGALNTGEEVKINDRIYSITPDGDQIIGEYKDARYPFSIKNGLGIIIEVLT